MMAGILEVLGIGKKEGFQPTRVAHPDNMGAHSSAVFETHRNIWGDPERLLGKKELDFLKQLVDDLIHFRYSDCPPKALATPVFEYLPKYYARISCVAPPRNKWGLFTMSADPSGNLFQGAEHSSFVLYPLPAKEEKGFGLTLAEVAGALVINKYSTHYFSDIRHMRSLLQNAKRVPREMKNGKANLFIGTTVMIHSEPHTLAVTWKDRGFEIEFVSLHARLEDTAQIVTLRRF